MYLNGVVRYYPVLNIPEATSGSLSIEHSTRPPGYTFITGNARTAIFGQPTTKVSYDYETRWHTLVDPDGVWMTDLPIEQRQHDVLLRGFSGTVLVGGLGLGYAVTVLALRRAVTKIVVVEKSPDVVALVWPHLGEQVHSKTECVTEDLFEFLKRPCRFRYGFYDIWRSDGEYTFHNVVVPLRRLSANKVKNVRCWNEDIMRGQLLLGITGKFHMLKMRESNGDWRRKIPSLDELCEPIFGDACYYWNWAVPFWRWYRDHHPTELEAQNAAMLYAFAYGREEVVGKLEAKFGPIPIIVPDGTPTL